MYETIQYLHSYWAYLVVLMVALATFNALAGYFGNREFGPKDFRVSLFALIVSHIQLIIGLVLYFVSPNAFGAIKRIGMGGVMKDASLRLLAVEHLTVMVLAIVLITIGYSKHKKKLVSKPKFKMLAIFYTLAFILMLSRIPWSQWF